MGARLTQEVVLSRFKKKWKDWKERYDYSKVVYEKQEETVRITCLKNDWQTKERHGEFTQKPIDHWLGKQGCDKCKADNKRKLYLKPLRKFIEDARMVHGDYYDYGKVDYQGAFVDVTIICPIHEDFPQTPNAHINAGSGCPDCGDERGALKNATPFEVFVKRAKRVTYQSTPTQEGIIQPVVEELKSSVLPMESFGNKQSRTL